MKLQNISNYKRTVHLFVRDDDNTLHIHEDNSFYPYFYQKSEIGEYEAYDGCRVEKVFCNVPSDVAEMRTNESYEADILFHKRYLVDKICNIEYSPIKAFFFDIEILADEMPDPNVAKDTISCITVYNSLYKSFHTWYLPDYINEKAMLNDFVGFIKMEAPDMLLAWNNYGFDYPYLMNRIKDFAREISPINQVRYGESSLLFPAGISILDYMTMFKKISMREQSYALDNIAQKHLEEEAWQKTSFNEINELVKKH